MRDDQSALTKVLALSTAIEVAVQKGELIVSVPTKYGSDCSLDGLEANPQAIDYIIQTGDS